MRAMVLGIAGIYETFYISFKKSLNLNRVVPIKLLASSILL
jgi:hypothetical protein